MNRPRTTPVAVIGAGGFAREVLDVLDAIARVDGRFDLVGVFADGRVDRDLLAARGVRYCGSVAKLDEQPYPYVIGIGDGAVRRTIDRRLAHHGVECPVLVHPSVTMGFDVRLGPGTVVCAHVSLTTNIRVGRHVHVNLNSTVGHDTVLGDYVTISPLVAVSGNVTVEEGATLGTSAALIEKLSVGSGTTVGAGAVVVRDLPADVVAVGMPAKPR